MTENNLFHLGSSQPFLDWFLTIFILKKKLEKHTVVSKQLEASQKKKCLFILNINFGDSVWPQVELNAMTRPVLGNLVQGRGWSGFWMHPHLGRSFTLWSYNWFFTLTLCKQHSCGGYDHPLISSRGEVTKCSMTRWITGTELQKECHMKLKMYCKLQKVAWIAYENALLH